MATFTQFLPSPGQTGVARTTLVSFRVLEGADGAVLSTLAASVGGQQAIKDGLFVNGFNGQVIPGAGGSVVAIHPKAPGFLPSASQVDVSVEVRDSYGALDSYGWSFFTVGYVAPGTEPPPPLGGPVPPSEPSRACLVGKPFFVANCPGLRAALDAGIGTEVDLEWGQASPYDENNFVVYNVYFSTSRIEVFEGAPRFLATGLGAAIGGLPPGDSHFFGIRAAELDPSVSSLSGLRPAGTDLFFYPSTELSSAVGDGYTTIPVASVSGFPDAGVAIVDDELIKYDSLQPAPPALLLADAYGRGYEGSVADAHAAGAEVRLYHGREDGNTVIAQATPSFQKPEPQLTYVLGDGIGPDGYRDGYDGYDASGDGYYFHRQVKRDDITGDTDGNDALGDFASFDHCGTYRRDPPRALWQGGACVGSYFGGVQFRDGVFVREPDVQTHMLQREELLLETTGEPMVLLRRKWTGIRCTCHMMRREHADKRCPVCFGTGFQNGYDQFISPRRSDGRVLVRVNPANDDLKIEDKGGLTPDYIPGCWTIAYPGIKDRDVLIRFNEDNTEAFRYIILNVERVRAFFGQQGAQKFVMQRYHRTDVIYQFPAQRDMSPFPETVQTGVASGPGIPAHAHVVQAPSGIALGSLNGVTAVGERHSHVIRNGIVLPALGHTHTLVL